MLWVDILIKKINKCSKSNTKVNVDKSEIKTKGIFKNYINSWWVK